ncbi:MAG TPA: type II toxin-antitoxin system ParD family antitoxin [Paracoccaceae bacterium]|nr:type II toxin-antitoxin system ParD family antitoxin [Paracoccaceae bacterium]
MPTRNVVLTEHHERLIAELVASGRYQNASEVLREGLRLIERREREEAAKLAALHAAIDEAEQSIARGEVYDYEPGMFDRILREELGD